MATATGTHHTIVVPIGQEKAFSYLGNPVSMREWLPEGAWDVWLTSPTPVGKGSTFRARRSGTVEEHEGSVTEFQANERIAFRLTHGSRETIWSFTLATQSGGTEVRCSYDVHTHGVQKVAEPLLRRGVGHHADEALAKLRSRLGEMPRPLAA